HTNAFRKQAGRRELAVDNVLMEAAAIRVIEITQLFAHVRPNGLAPNSIDRSILGENIAMGNPLLTAESAAKGFMSSPGHKDNMLRAGFTKMGAACYKVGGVYYWVQLFG
ncbi:CAP domain-containing protein, partial [Christensenellaceae bacterium OttesenSCG-928-L17]|nr:CAP domain-containing protein [Christensenellaceae bacterium OttesenSCG-928-L17]